MVTYNEKYLWTDPLADSLRGGVLLSDEILLFVNAVHLIEPTDFREEDLRPAAYDLHIGDTYYVDDKPKKLGRRQWFKIPANGLVYVKTRERFNIPYYMVARYSLRVTQVYRGLLIDNGLHIDPGYHGPIYVPVHNFANQDRPLSEGEKFLSVEFARTTPIQSDKVQSIQTELQFVSVYGKQGIDGRDGNKVRLFNKDPEDLRKAPITPETFWNRFPGEQHRSAIIGQLSEVTAKVDRLTNIGLLGLAGLFITLFAMLFPWISGRYLDTERAYRESGERLRVISQEVEELKRQLTANAPGAATRSAPAPQQPIPPPR